MAQDFPIANAWRVLKQFRYLWLIPLVWDLAKRGLAWALQDTGLIFARWDFAVGYEYIGTNWTAWFVLPPSLPSVEQVGYALAPAMPNVLTTVQVVAIGVMLLMDTVIKAGFLTMLVRMVRGEQPSIGDFADGVRRHGWQLLLIMALWLGYYTLLETLVSRGVIGSGTVPLLSWIAIPILLTAEFLVVAEDAFPLAAVVGAPFVLWQQFGAVIVALAFSAAVSATLTGLTSLLGLSWFVLLAPAYAYLGTWVAATAFCALAPGMVDEAVQESLKDEPATT